MADQEDSKKGESTGANAEEAKAFLNGSSDVAASKVDIVGTQKDIEEGGHPKRRFHKKWCLIATASVAAVIAVILLAGLVRFLVYWSKMSGRATAGTSAEWDALLRESGAFPLGWRKEAVYEFISYSDSYDDYLMALGTPSWVLGLAKSSSERITVSSGGEGDSLKWHFKTDTSEREWEFGLDREFTTTWGRDKGTMHVTCTSRTESTLVCSKEERQKSWSLSDTFEFFEKGIIRTIDFLGGNKNHNNVTISASKYYERLLREEDINAGLKGPRGDHDDESTPFSEDNEEDETFFDDDF